MALRNSRKVAVITTFAALTLATNYALAPFPNIKLFDTLVFISALLFGLDVGLSTAVLSWLVYGSVNPWGTASLYLISILAVSETVYAFFGWFASRLQGVSLYTKAERSLMFGLMGLIGALIYDVNTIVTPFVLIGFSVSTSFLYLLNPATLWFMLAHELSDFVFFSTIAPILIVAISRLVPAWLRSPKIGQVIAR